jgi:hypothetical protein
MYSEFARKASYKDFKIIYLKSRHRKIRPLRKLRKMQKLYFLNLVLHCAVNKAWLCSCSSYE